MDLKWRKNFHPKCVYNEVLPMVTPDGRILPCCFCHGDNLSLREWAGRQNLDIDTDMRISGEKTIVDIMQTPSYRRLRYNFTVEDADLPYVCHDNCTDGAYESIDGVNGGSKWKKYDG